MLEVKFYDTVDDALLKFAVIISQSNGKWVFCKHRERDTYEVPGGHREEGESILETARRELQEETGAVKFDIKPICVYSVIGKTRVNNTGEESFGVLCFAEITEFSGELHSEMEKVVLMAGLPENWTYPLIQPKLIEKYLQIEKTLYSQIQLAAKQTIEYIKKMIKPGMNLIKIRKACEEKLHAELLRFATKETTFEELYYHMNGLIVEKGFVNLDFMGNLGHSIAKTKNDRIYIEKGNTVKLGEVNYFTFEPHISVPNSKYGYKKENIYYFNKGKLVEL